MERGTVRAANPSRKLIAIETKGGAYSVIRMDERVEVGDVLVLEAPGGRIYNETKRRDVNRWELRASNVPPQQVREHLFPPPS